MQAGMPAFQSMRVPVSAQLWSSYFRQQRPQLIHRCFVRGPVRCQNAVMILHVVQVVPHWLAEDVGHSPSGFLENYLGAARIPGFCSWRKVDIEIAYPLGNKPDL